MRLGIDVSENNGHINWEAVKAAGVKFAIIRLGYGNCHLDSMFYENINGAIDAGLDVGVYYYSYALDEDMALNEARFLIETLEDAGLYNEKLPMGIWLDMEDADGYKSRHGNFGAKRRTGKPARNKPAFSILIFFFRRTFLSRYQFEQFFFVKPTEFFNFYPLQKFRLCATI